MARKWLVMFGSMGVTWWLLFLLHQYNIFESPEPDWTWMVSQRNLSFLIQDENHSYFLPPRPVCSDNLDLIVIVCSSASNFVSRNAIRSTWGSKAWINSSVKLLFIVGISDNVTNIIIQEEKKVYTDIIHYNFLDTYNNLTIKSVMLLQWVSRFCLNAKYIMKTDDDMFVNIPNLLNYLLNHGKKKLLMGHVITNAVPVKEGESKWYTPKDIFSGLVYPDYLSGTGYVMSNDIIPLLYKTALKINFFFLEDIFITGICAEVAGFYLVNHDGFDYRKRESDPCIFKDIITSHRMTANELYEMWQKLCDPSIHCLYWEFPLKNFWYQ